MSYLNLLMENFNRLDSRTRVRWGAGLASLLLLAIILTGLNGRVALLAKKRTVREADLTEMMVLKQRYQEANAVSQKLANRMAATRADDSPAKIIDEIGIKGKGSQFKQVKGESRSGYVEDAVEARIDALSANEAVNLIYRLENGAKPIIIKKALIKTRFDDPAKLDLTLTIALLKPAPKGQK
jgi:general secretion pathway protein M